ncbi:MAG: cyclase family protein [Candidatus Delongbacteria bacterium]|jgi:kynurenine formamidase|nr:cyclase family protein [Candidatus Delongbacteria bacterium]
MAKKIIDLTHTINEKMTVYPGTPSPIIKDYSTIGKEGFAELLLTMVTHTGTHIDAPCHIMKEAKTLSDFPLDKFAGRAIVIDCERKNEISLELLKSRENDINKVEFVLFRSGWSRKWKEDDYFGKFPVLTTEAAKWLSGFDLKAVGFDYVSVDAMDASELPNHRILLSKEILIIENLTDLDKLPETKFDFYAIPLKIGNADGSPVRAFAELII